MNVDARARQQEASELARALRAFLQGVDVADISRALGDRVRDLREEASAPSPPSRGISPRASAASHGDLGTKTFAARDEALAWSNPPPSVSEDPDGLPVPSTRRLDESTPKLPAARPVRGRRDDPAMSIATPLMVDVDDLEKIHGEIDAARSGKSKRSTANEPEATPVARPAKQSDIPTVRRSKFSRPPTGTSATQVETIATRPLETPVRAFDRASLSTTAARGRSFTLVGIAALLGLGGFVAWRTRGGPPPEPARPAVVNTTTVAPLPLSSVDVSPPVPPVSAAMPVQTPAPSAPATAAPAISASAITTGKASATFLGEPGTRVSIDGTSRGACPVRVMLAEGPHEVRFTFDPTGESRGERFTVKNGDHVTVRAEFTGATPTVKIQR
jgi:hypothetical protein